MRLPPKNYGGVERVVLWLARGLVQRGHEVWVAAEEGSELPPGVRLIPISPQKRSAWDLLPLLPKGIDVVHWMAPPESGAAEQLPCPSLLTVHGNGKPGEVFGPNTYFLSRDHAARHGSSQFVYNGIDPEELEFAEQKSDSYLFLSKTNWSVKNLRGAVRISQGAHTKLAIAGGTRPWGVRLQAALSSSLAWHGSVSGAKKARLLAQSRGLLFPVLWPEPFGLVVIEALMSGTPVIASRQGSLPELISSEVGMLLDPPDTTEREQLWVENLVRITASGTAALRWSAEACREHAIRHFHYLKMAEGYENAYKQLKPN